MRIYFSGGRGLTCTPEALVPERKPHVMLTYHDIDSPGTYERLRAYLARKGLIADNGKGKGLYSRTIFMDSGAYTLFNDHVHKRRDKRPRKTQDKRILEDRGSELHPPKIFRGRGDYNHYDLSKGTEFRKYCDKYAKFIRRMKGHVLTTNVDAIMNPEITWKIQRFFEEEHGVQPIPVIHGLTPMRYLHRYLDAGRYDLIGLGGLGHAVSLESYVRWANEVFLNVCPASNNHVPKVRVHGFAMTSWYLICHYPWWSVDSATWVKLSAYGWLYVPRWSESKGWQFDKPPMQINVSHGKSDVPKDVGLLDIPAANNSPLGKKTNKHLDNVAGPVKEVVLRWIKRCGVEAGSVDSKGKMKEFGVRSHFRARSVCNLYYLKDLEESRPPYPYALDTTIVKQSAVNHHKGLGL